MSLYSLKLIFPENLLKQIFGNHEIKFVVFELFWIFRSFEEFLKFVKNIHFLVFGNTS
jgi:hypothetical protein